MSGKPEQYPPDPPSHIFAPALPASLQIGVGASTDRDLSRVCEKAFHRESALAGPAVRDLLYARGDDSRRGFDRPGAIPARRLRVRMLCGPI